MLILLKKNIFIKNNETKDIIVNLTFKYSQ